jgi:uncharacterized protein (TIGR03435 family)
MPKRLLLTILAAVALLPAQQPTYTFSVVSVKPNTSADFRSGVAFGFQPGGRFEMHNLSLRFVIAMAYNVPFQSTRLTGGPEWLGSERFDIDATADPAALPPDLPTSERRDRQRAMLRAMLADRFHLVVRTETKELPIYAEVVNKGGLKLKPSSIAEKDCDESTCHSFMGGRGRGMHSKAADLTDLALYVSNWTDRPVIDATGVKGLFEIDTKPWVSLESNAPAAGAKGEDGTELADLSTVFTVFTEMGLKLEPRKAPIEMYTIEKVERPAAN